MFLTLGAICFIIINAIASAKPRASVVIFYSTKGAGNWGFADDMMAETWAERLRMKSLDPLWPVDAVVELLDFESNYTYLQLWTVARMANTSLPAVSTFIFNLIGIELMPWFAQFEVPCIIPSLNANVYSQNTDQGNGFNFTFFIEPAKQYYSRELADLYSSVGVKSVVAIADLGDYIANPGIDYSYSWEGCIRTAEELMVPKGIELLGTFTFYIQTATRDDYVEIIEEVKKLNPDAVMLCDWAATEYHDLFDSWIVKVMRELDYLPKAMNIEDTYGTALAEHHISSGLLNFMTQAAFSHLNNKGIDFTEDAAPYSSKFIEMVPTTVGEAILAGSNLPGYSSSARIFSEWYANKTGHYPPYIATGIWGSYDVVEAALYWAASVDRVRPNNTITSNEMFAYLMQTNVATPYGRVIFDNNRINTASYVSVMQFFNDNDDTELISPKAQATHTFVYPMPTWSERSYSWSLMKGSTQKCVILAAVCTAVIAAILVTLGIHQDATDVKMLSYPHLVALGVAGLILIWSLVFVWQGDVVTAQCNGYLWSIYLPGSFLVMLMSMKAYRLSVFITSENKMRKRKLNHNRVMFLTFCWVGFTAIMLGIAQFVDPPKRELVQTDIYRPSTDYYVCRHGNATGGILYFLVAEHILVSLICVFFVRNGSESFKDGLLMKEAFVILFTCVFITYVFSNLGLSAQAFYFLRTVFIAVGVTLFFFRLLFSRCAKHWVTQSMQEVLSKYYKIYKSFMPEVNATSEAKVSAIEMYTLDLDDNQGRKDDYEVGYNESNSTENLDKIFSDDKRLELFRELAKKGSLIENVDFLLTVRDIPSKFKDALVSNSNRLTQPLQQIAQAVYDEYCMEGSANEVNISSNVRYQLKERVLSLPTDKPILSDKLATTVIKDDLLGAKGLFDPAVQEIKLMLHQNLWNKFKITETEIHMGSDQI